MAQRFTANLQLDIPSHYPTLIWSISTKLLFVSTYVCATYVPTAANIGQQ